MPVQGVILHQSVCPSINGKGFDFFVTQTGIVIPGAEQTDPGYVHICIEGDFDAPTDALSPALHEQLFLAHKLIQRLAAALEFSPSQVIPHSSTCPGRFFPWSMLVISDQDRYH
ncbi:hypothetical protein [Paenibacillus sp. y28]|uniref:hypothetical protein n=1 Tax=Paenibacillus sp. y28 TaxID=3129110 RepID=UPI00301B0115